MPESQQLAPLAQSVEPIPSRFKRDYRVRNVVLDRDSLTELFELVKTRTEESYDCQIRHEEKNSQLDPAEIPDLVRKYYRVSYVITDNDQNSMTGHDALDFSQSNIPDDILSIFITNKAIFSSAAENALPQNVIDLSLNFGRPPLPIDFNNQPSNETVNISGVEISGYDESWVLLTLERISQFFDKKSANRSAIHKNGAFDLFLFLVFYPIVLWLGYKIERQYSDFFANQSVVVSVAMILYGLVFVIWTARSVFTYMRWLFPIVEYSGTQNSSAKNQRWISAGVLLSIVGAIAYDVLKFLVFN